VPQLFIVAAGCVLGLVLVGVALLALSEVVIALIGVPGRVRMAVHAARASWRGERGEDVLQVPPASATRRARAWWVRRG
jgi:hypothetical protein